MKQFLLILFVFIAANGKASESYIMMPYELIYDSLDESLPKNQVVYLFDLSTLDPLLRDAELIYSIDNGQNLQYDFSQGDTLKVVTTPGTHYFQLYAGDKYMEVAFETHKIEERHRRLYRIHFTRTYKMDVMRKPVIYLYPQETTEISVKVNPAGTFTFTYPPIEKGWNFTCDPDGTIKDGKDEFRYLFWESEQDISAELIDRKSGIILPGSEAVRYLENQLQQFGLNSVERTDFISYWGPILQTKSNLYIYLLFNEVCDAFASLEIAPKPTQIQRFYVIWAAVPDDYNPSLEPQEVPKMQRDGFTVLEWGGAEVQASKVLLE